MKKFIKKEWNIADWQGLTDPLITRENLKRDDKGNLVYDAFLERPLIRAEDFETATESVDKSTETV